MYFFPLILVDFPEYVPFSIVLTVYFPINVPFCAFCRFVPSAVLCLPPFCASAVMFYAVLCVCRFVRLLLCFMLFCVSAVLCVCRFGICRFVCASLNICLLYWCRNLIWSSRRYRQCKIWTSNISEYKKDLLLLLSAFPTRKSSPLWQTQAKLARLIHTQHPEGE